MRRAIVAQEEGITHVFSPDSARRSRLCLLPDRISGRSGRDRPEVGDRRLPGPPREAGARFVTSSRHTSMPTTSPAVGVLRLRRARSSAFRATPRAPATGGLRDGDVISVGDVEVRVIGAPGHRPEHLAFLIAGPGAADEPTRSSISGDSLLVGGLARPDLAIDAADGGRALWGSIQPPRRTRRFASRSGLATSVARSAGAPRCATGLRRRRRRAANEPAALGPGCRRVRRVR